MPLTSALLTVLGLILFEIVSSIDNAVINAEVLVSLPAKSQRWFMRWGLLFAVIGIRGILPWLIIWIALPNSSPIEALRASTSINPAVEANLQRSAAVLLTVGGTMLTLLFLYWFTFEHHFKKFSHGHRFALFAISAGSLLFLLAKEADSQSLLHGIAIGIVGFFVLLAVKRLAALPKQKMSRAANRNAKMIYLEAMDSIFSIEGVLGAFVFTFSVPLILLGNGIGAIIVRRMTALHGVKIRKLAYLKLGAMYALAFIGIIMLCDGLGNELPSWLSLITTVISICFAFLHNQTKKGGS